MIGIGGFFGSIARYGVYIITLRHLGEKTYLATLIVNLIGCLLIGLLAGGLLKLNQNQNLLLITGLCGGFTTFSAFAFDGFKLLKSGMYFDFALYAIVSVVGGALLCFLGLSVSGK